MDFATSSEVCFRGFASPAGQIPHLVRHNCKPGGGLPSPCCFHRGVQRQNVGLESDFVDYLVDPRNLLAGFLNSAHHLVQVPNLDNLTLDRAARRIRQFAGIRCIARIGLDLRLDLCHGTAHFFEGCRQFCVQVAQLILRVNVGHDFYMAQAIARLIRDVRSIHLHTARSAVPHVLHVVGSRTAVAETRDTA
jgi:hypothetical protein